MAGNSARRGAMRKTKKGPSVGTGGHGRKKLAGKGPTPKAADRPAHPAGKRKAAAERAQDKTARDEASRGGARRTAPTGAGGRTRPASTGRPGTGRPGAGRRAGTGAEYIAGRNSVVEALRAGIPAQALYLQDGMDSDPRVTEAVSAASGAGLSLLEVGRVDLDRLTDGAVHQGVALQIPSYDYAHPMALLDLPRPKGPDGRARPALVVALDGITDPRNLGAVVRSAAAFGALGVVVPERRSAQMSAGAWKSSAGAAVRVRVARATNLTRALQEYAKAGLLVVGLDADGEMQLPELDVAGRPVCLVVGAEGAGLSRLVRESCDVVVSIPMQAATESLNAGVAAGVALYAVAQQR